MSTSPITYLTRRFSFSASHRLHSTALSASENAACFGMCEHVHGHNYRLEVTVRGQVDPARGFFCNVLDLKGTVDRLVAEVCEHRHLNDLELFRGVEPTTMENLAARIWQVLEPALGGQGMALHEILLAETDDNIVRLRRE